jgi:hypothetical protein
MTELMQTGGEIALHVYERTLLGEGDEVPLPLWKTSIVLSVKRASTVSRNRANGTE